MGELGKRGGGLHDSRPGRRLARINYAIRSGSFAFSFLVVGIHGWQHGWGAMFWALAAAQFLVYPHLAYLAASRAANPQRAEHFNLQLDAAMLGAWVAAMHLPAWLVYGALFSVLLNMTVVLGTLGFARAAGFFALGALAGGAASLLAPPLSNATSPLVAGLSFFGSLGYACAVGCVVHWLREQLATQQEAISASEARYRLLAENAADLIGVVDAEGRWAYASPSYGRVLDPADLATGADAFRRLHPDDAERARSALARGLATGKPRELALRMVDREGRMRQWKSRVQPLPGRRELVLVSSDVTDLRESEERMLVAAHALEGMTEAIMIIAADGTVVSVNRAYSEITGIPRDEVVGQSEKAFRTALQPPQFHDDAYAAVQRDGHWSGITWSRRRNGSLYREWRSLSPVRDPAGGVSHYVMVFYELGDGGANVRRLDGIA